MSEASFEEELNASFEEGEELQESKEEKRGLAKTRYANKKHRQRKKKKAHLSGVTAQASGKRKFIPKQEPANKKIKISQDEEEKKDEPKSAIDIVQELVENPQMFGYLKMNEPVPLVYYNAGEYDSAGDTKWALCERAFSKALLANWPPKGLPYPSANPSYVVHAHKTAADTPYATKAALDDCYYHVVQFNISTGKARQLRVDLAAHYEEEKLPPEETQLMRHGLAELVAAGLDVPNFGAVGSLSPGGPTFTELLTRYDPSRADEGELYGCIAVWPETDGIPVREALGRFVLHHFLSTVIQPPTMEGVIEEKERTRVIQVERIEAIYNPHLDYRYRRMEEEYMENYSLRELSVPAKLESRYVWHGTSPEIASVIAKYGWRAKFNCRHEYGVGNYFARNASYSNDFSRGTGGSSRQMLLGRIITEGAVLGKSKTFQPGHSLPVWMPSGNGCPAYPADVAVDNLKNPFIYVCNRDESCLPLAIVTYSYV